MKKAQKLCYKRLREVEEMKTTPLEPLPKIGAPALRALNSIGVDRLSQLSNYTEQQLLQLHGFGPKALRILKESLKDHGLSFRKEDST